ncbi:NADH dehydrogenase [ubiquinone] 1 beta subcomplex subunit 7 [Trichogramma pretiosum]|uniref:NADH dehydrogenase [ubiquinone] 1 beta subcomplex subunit 7 n=1 Tax=Trichogramma kaykai TaxID=54128 RepID=A0ABD2WFM2_9HYME|nr:NADH dehydrogenase [ubiquinone] 1 beta subcomplex subunit 7 [Trichogramma pretiosum]
MGNLLLRTWEQSTDPEYQPKYDAPPSFDPHLGFQGKREERVMIATEQELRAAKIPKEDWDYCAHHRLDLARCRADVFPFVWKCRDEAATVSHCLKDDWIIRMKEYERERRLLQRKKIQDQAAAA